MADEVPEIEVECAQEISLSLHIGGSFSYKWQLYEYPAAGAPAPAAPEQQGKAVVTIGKLEKGVVRRFVWSVVVVSNDDDEQTVDVVGHVMVDAKSIGTVKGKLPVKKPLLKAFVNVHVKGKAT